MFLDNNVLVLKV